MNKDVNKATTIAIILSVYKNDSLSFVKEAIESLLLQTYTDFDIFIQLDGIVREEVESYLCSLEDGRIHIFKREINKGLAFSLNELIERVLLKDYEFIARMDADDVSLPFRFEEQVSYMMQHPEVDCLGTWAIEINKDGEDFFKKKMPVTHEECLELFRKRDCMIHPTVMFRRSFFEKAGLYPEDTYFGEDTMMWAKGFKNGCKFANVPQYLLKFRLDENFFDRRRGWKHAKSIFMLRKKVNKMLGFGISSYIYAWMYAGVKLMPARVLNLIYKRAR